MDRILGFGQRHVQDQHVSRIEAGINIQETKEASNQQAGACQENERQGNFGDNQAGAHSILGGGRRAAPGFLQRKV